MRKITDEHRAILPPDIPYRGIRYFRFMDQQIFFARDREVKKLQRLVTMYRGTLLYGGSGVGKSSLVNSGLIPAAINDGYIPEKIRVQPRRGGEIIVERIVASVSKGKRVYLPSVFVEDDSPFEHEVLSLETFKERLRAAVESDARPLLIFDQFEEFITQFEEAPSFTDLKEAVNIQENILNALVALLRDPSLAVKLLFVFREDYLARLSKLFEKEPDLLDQYLRLKPVQKEYLAQIIRGPFEDPELRRHFGKEISPELADQMKAQITEQGDGYLNLTEIQIACLKLWQAADPQRLFHYKGIKGLLGDYLTEALGKLPEDLHDIAVALLGRLVTASGLRNVVCEEDLIQHVQNELKIDSQKAAAALQKLEQDAKLLRREMRRDLPYYEIVSEFLVPWITQLKSEQQSEIKRRKEWKRKTKKFFIIASLIFLTFLTIYFIKYFDLTADNLVKAARKDTREAIATKKKAEDELAKALRDKKIAETERNDAISERDEVRNQLREAIEEYKRKIKESETVKGELKDLTKTFNQKEIFLNGLHKEIDKTEKIKKEERTAIEKLEKEKNRLGEDIEKEKNKLQRLKGLLEGGERVERAIYEMLGKLDKPINDMNEDIIEFAFYIKEVKLNLKEVTELRLKARDKLREGEDELLEVIEDIDDEIDEKVNIEKKVSANINKIDGEIANLNKVADEVEDVIEKLESDKEERIDSPEGLKKGFRKNIDDLKDEINDEIEKVENAINKMDDAKIDALKQKNKMKERKTEAVKKINYGVNRIRDAIDKVKEAVKKVNDAIEAKEEVGEKTQKLKDKVKKLLTFEDD